MILSPDLIVRLADRIRDPARRSDHGARMAGAVSTPVADIRAAFESNLPGSGQGMDLMIGKMRDWGFSAEAMNFADLGGGAMWATSDDPAAPLAPPPGEARLDAAEATMQVEMPEGLRQLYALADGGFGPGLGLHPIDRLVDAYQDFCRRGPDYTGDLQWPRHLLPMFDAAMVPTGHGFDAARTLSIDTISGAVVTFDEDWSQHEITADAAWSTVAPSLSDLLEEWLGRAAAA